MQRMGLDSDSGPDGNSSNRLRAVSGGGNVPSGEVGDCGSLQMFDSIILVNIMVIGLQVNFSRWGNLKKIWGKQEEKAMGDHKHYSFYLFKDLIITFF